jgi:hypothetical protein
LVSFIIKIIKLINFKVALGNVTQSTESDNLARCLVYLYEEHGKTLDLILTFIDIEIGVASESTLFRSNSPVTRMFKYYSKMIGIHYLFDNLAKYIAELEASQRQKQMQKKSESELELMNPVFDLEVDPSKMTSEEDENVNKLQLQLVVQKIFNAIMRSAAVIPA